MIKLKERYRGLYIVVVHGLYLLVTNDWHSLMPRVSFLVLAFRMFFFQVLSARAVDENCTIPDLSPLISNIINNDIYSCRWIESEENKFKELFKLEKVGKDKKDQDNVYKDRYVCSTLDNIHAHMRYNILPTSQSSRS